MTDTIEITTQDILTKARALVREGWWQGFEAGDAQGRDVGRSDPGAVKFCPLGAMRWMCDTYNVSPHPSYAAYNAAVQRRWCGRGESIAICDWNDDQDRILADVTEAFDLAIRIVNKEGEQ